MSSARVIFSTGSLYVYDVSLVFELAAAAGYDGIEIMCDHRWSTRDPEYLDRLSQQYGLPVLVVHTPFSPTIPGWRNRYNPIRRIEQSIDLARAIKAETLVVHLPARRENARLSFNQRALQLPFRLPPRNPVKRWIENELPGRQRRLPVKIALENLPVKALGPLSINNTWWNTIPEWSQLHEWLTLDTTHWATHRLDPLEAYRAARGRVANVHLSNYRDGKEHRLPHKGELDLRAFLMALAADRFAGTISLELHPDALEFERGIDRVAAHMRASLDFCREALARGAATEPAESSV